MALRSGARSSAAAAIFFMEACGEKWDLGKMAPSLRPRSPDCGGRAVWILASVAVSSGFCNCSLLVRAKREGWGETKQGASHCKWDIVCLWRRIV